MINALTYRAANIEKCIQTPVTIQNTFTKKVVNTMGIWDTGATNSCITKALVDELGLTVIQKVQVTGIHGTKEANVYYVNITLNNQNITIDALVTEVAELSSDHKTGFLIGMNIIAMGDFCISNNGVTVMTFRVPSLETIDYVQEIEQNNRTVKIHQAQSRQGNERCPCGSGKLYKNCCQNNKYNR